MLFVAKVHATVSPHILLSKPVHPLRLTKKTVRQPSPGSSVFVIHTFHSQSFSLLTTSDSTSLANNL
jgi:hypothetical protein